MAGLSGNPEHGVQSAPLLLPDVPLGSRSPAVPCVLPSMADPDATISLTYKQLADRLGSSPDAARIKAKRQGWPLVKGNHPSDATHVLVPRAFLEGSARSPGNGSPFAPPDVPPPAPPDSAAIKAMEARIQDLQDQLGRERMRADQAEERADAVRREAQAERDQLRGDVAAAHDRLAMALALVGQIQADAEKERSRLIAE